MKKRHLAALFAATISSAALAGDTAFTPDAAATWSARSLQMAGVLDQAAAGTLSKASFATACDGLTGEQMKHEYGKEPRWALASQLDICSAYNGFAGKFGASKNPCSSLKKGLGELDGATPESSPPEVVSAAAALRTTVTALLGSTDEHKRACKA